MGKVPEGYSDRAWIRVYDAVLDDRKLQTMEAGTFRFLVNCWLLARRSGNQLGEIEQLAFCLRLSLEQTIQHVNELTESGHLLIGDSNRLEVKNWVYWQAAPLSTERVKAHRERKKGEVKHDETSMKRDETIETFHGVSPMFHETHETFETVEKKRKEEKRKEQTERVLSFDLETAFEEIWNAYPAKGRTKQPMSMQYYVEAVATLPDDQQAAMHAKILAPLLSGGKWASSAQWAKGFVQGLPVYLNQMQWLESPEPAVKESYTLDLREPEDDAPIVRGELPVFSDEEFAADIARMHSK